MVIRSFPGDDDDGGDDGDDGEGDLRCQDTHRAEQQDVTNDGAAPKACSTHKVWPTSAKRKYNMLLNCTNDKDGTQ